VREITKRQIEIRKKAIPIVRDYAKRAGDATACVGVVFTRRFPHEVLSDGISGPVKMLEMDDKAVKPLESLITSRDRAIECDREPEYCVNHVCAALCEAVNLRTAFGLRQNVHGGIVTNLWHFTSSCYPGRGGSNDTFTWSGTRGVAGHAEARTVGAAVILSDPLGFSIPCSQNTS
jgi:hypothetical protein